MFIEVSFQFPPFLDHGLNDSQFKSSSVNSFIFSEHDSLQFKLGIRCNLIGLQHNVLFDKRLSFRSDIQEQVNCPFQELFFFSLHTDRMQ